MARCPTRMYGNRSSPRSSRSLVITTGTAGGIGKDCEVGDVIVSPIVRFDCLKWLKSEPYHNAVYKDGAPSTRLFATAKTLFKANSGQLPKDNTRAPRIVQSASLPKAVLTTDFFGFDTSDNHYGLQGLGAVSEMGDAVLGLVAKDMGRQRSSLGCGAQRLRSPDKSRKARSSSRRRSRRRSTKATDAGVRCAAPSSAGP